MLCLGNALSFADAGFSLSETTLTTGPRLPCASVLVRIVSGARLSVSAVDGPLLPKGALTCSVVVRAMWTAGFCCDAASVCCL